jgi:hypothetical protein
VFQSHPEKQNYKMSARDPDRKGMDTSGTVEYGAKLPHYSWYGAGSALVAPITIID